MPPKKWRREVSNGSGKDQPRIGGSRKNSPEVSGMGHRMKRKEDARFLQGRGNYVDDVNLPHMVYGHMVRSPYAHARIKEHQYRSCQEAARRPGSQPVKISQS